MKYVLFTVVSIFILSTLISCHTSTKVKENNRPIVVLTFDDAEISHYTNVAPLLKKYDFNATFFVCEFPCKTEEEKPFYMSWEQIKELNDQGFEIGNHTGHHKNVTKLSRSEIVKEVQYIENKCKQYNIPHPVTFAYPGNRSDSASVAVLDSLGYHFARVGSSRPYNSESDINLQIPSYTTASTEKLKTRVHKALQNLKPKQIMVLTFHGIPDIIHPDYSTTTEHLEEIFKLLSNKNYHVIAMKELNSYISNNH